MTFALPANPQSAHVAAMATPLVIAGYPLLESLRTCRVQTTPDQRTGYGRAPMGQFSYSDHIWTHLDRDVVTPANDLLYFCGWVNLKQAPAWLTAPAPTGRYFVVELLDAYTENFLNVGTRKVPPNGGRFMLTGPSTPPQTASDAVQVVCPTDVVWLLGRVLVSGDADFEAAKQFMQGFTLQSTGGLPETVRHWQDTGDEAVDFFANLLRASEEFPPPPGSGDLSALHVALGLPPGDTDKLARSNARVLDGLRAAYRHGMQIIEAHTTSQTRKAWGYSTKLGCWGGNLLMRATTAFKGLGALSAEETIYAMADFDSAGEALSGRQTYTLRFAPGELPPADAFWSVTLYGDDRYFAANPIGRYAIGDRTEGLLLDDDGGLTLNIQHTAPQGREPNWLPAPSGSFYLILRCYQPREALLTGRYAIPPVQRAPTMENAA